MKQILFPLLFVVITAVGAQDEAAQLRLMQPVGVGARAFALANNHVALSTGISDLFWNPAALSFAVTREFQASLYGIRTNSSSLFFDTGTDDVLQRFNMGNVGFSIALPTARGGLSFAFAYSNPIVFDGLSTFAGNYQDLYTGDIVSVDYNTVRNYGGLNYWTAGFGLQLAPNFGIGLSSSLVTGKEKTIDQFREVRSYDGGQQITLVDDRIIGRYLGYDIRAGLCFKTDIIDAGARITVPQVMRLKEEFNDDPLEDTYTMYSSWAGAIGISATLPFITVSTEVRGTLPYSFLFPEEDIPESSQAGHTKIGAGVGIEVPMIVAPFIFRAGYSLDEVDLHQYMYLFENEQEFNWSDGGVKVDRNRHQISAGVGYTTASTSFDLAYGFSTWGLITNTYLEETFNAHRILASFTIRF